MTIQRCANICSDYLFFGVEHGDECYCGNTDDSFLPSDSFECNTPCAGNESEICGGSWRINVYQIKTISFHINDQSELLNEVDDIKSSFS